MIEAELSSYSDLAQVIKDMPVILRSARRMRPALLAGNSGTDRLVGHDDPAGRVRQRNRQELNKVWLSKPLRSRENTPIRVYLNGLYRVESIELDEEDGAVVLWLDERGDLGQP